MPVRSDIEKKFLQTTVLMVFLLGVVSIYGIVKDPNAASRQTRTLASITTASVEDEEKQIQTVLETINIDCANLSDSFVVAATHLRVKGVCQEKEITITNKTNGFTASVMNLKDVEFSTDYINLQEGDNQIEVTKTEKNGNKTSKQLLIQRRLPASLKQ